MKDGRIWKNGGTLCIIVGEGWIDMMGGGELYNWVFFARRLFCGVSRLALFLLLSIIIQGDKRLSMRMHGSG